MTNTLDFSAASALLGHLPLLKLQARYYRYMDEKEWDKWELLFVPHGLHVEAEGKTFSKRANFRALVSQLLEPATTHHKGFLPDITVDGTIATATWSMEDRLAWPARRTWPLGKWKTPGMWGTGYYQIGYAKAEAPEEGRDADLEGWYITSLKLRRQHQGPLPGGYPKGSPWDLMRP